MIKEMEGVLVERVWLVARFRELPLRGWMPWGRFPASVVSLCLVRRKRLRSARLVARFRELSLRGWMPWGRFPASIGGDVLWRSEE